MFIERGLVRILEPAPATDVVDKHGLEIDGAVCPVRKRGSHVSDRRVRRRAPRPLPSHGDFTAPRRSAEQASPQASRKLLAKVETSHVRVMKDLIRATFEQHLAATDDRRP